MIVIVWLAACGGNPGTRPQDPEPPPPPAARTFWEDADRDGYGNPARPLDAAEAPPGHVDNDDDCNDTSAWIHPGAGETCAPPDEDCDGLLGEADPDVTDLATFYADPDGDGYGDPEVTVEACDPPDGYVRVADCDHPGAPLDWPDGVDDDADGELDEILLHQQLGWFAEDIDYDFFFPMNLARVSTTVDVEGDGQLDWFLTVQTHWVWYYSAPGLHDGFFRVDDVGCREPGDLWAEPHLSLPGAVRVDRWEDVTGDGVPELLFARELWPDQSNPADLDLYLVDPTTTGTSAAVEDLALVHLHVAHGVAGPVGDYDGDGHPEVVLMDDDLRALVFVGDLTTGEPEALLDIQYRNVWLDLTAADLNGDGATDLTIGGPQRVLYGGPSLGALPLFSLQEVEPYGIRVADFDGDGFDDVATTAVVYSPPFVLPVHYGGPSGIASVPDRTYEIDAALRTVFPGDFDGDGLADLMVPGDSPFSSPHLRLGANGLATQDLRLLVDKATVITDRVEWGPMVDVDGDARDDLLVRNVRGPDHLNRVVVLFGAAPP